MGGKKAKQSRLKTKKGYNWFFIMCTWEHENDRIAMDKWVEVFNFFTRNIEDEEKKGCYEALRDQIADEGLTALNLIGKRQFIISGQTRSNQALQEISSMITLNTPVKVDISMATNVFEFGEVNKERLYK